MTKYGVPFSLTPASNDGVKRCVGVMLGSADAEEVIHGRNVKGLLDMDHSARCCLRCTATALN